MFSVTNQCISLSVYSKNLQILFSIRKGPTLDSRLEHTVESQKHPYVIDVVGSPPHRKNKPKICPR